MGWPQLSQGNAVLLEQRPLFHVGEKLSPIQPGKQ